MPDHTIIVADDDPTILQLMELVLADEGLVVRTARDGREALALVADEVPAVMVVDLRMPIVDGFAVVKRIRQDALTERVPIVVISAECSAVKISSLRVDAFLHKPFEIADFVNTIKGLMA